jgi:dipeptidyl aminopeptidase/acylaminoacyl peptidase
VRTFARREAPNYQGFGVDPAVMRRPLTVVLGLVVLSAACGAPPPSVPPTGKKQSVFATLGGEGPKGPTPAGKPEPPRADPSLLSRSILFSNPDRARPTLSPDGKRLAYLSSVDGVMNVWVAPANDLTKAKPVTQDRKRGIWVYRWAYTNDHVLYMQDRDGDENWHLHGVDLKSGADRDLTPLDGVQARFEEMSERFPREILIGLNDRDKRYHDVHRLDIVTGKRKLVQQNDGFFSFQFDHDYKLRLGMKPEKDGGASMMEPDGKGGFRELAKVPPGDSLTTHVLGFDKTGQKAYLADSRDRDTAALVELDLTTKKTKVLLDDGQADVSDIVQHPTDYRVQAALATYDRLRWHAIDASLRADLDVIQTTAPGDVVLRSRSLDDKQWIVSTEQSDAPLKFWSYDRAKKKLTFLFSNTKALEDVKLATMQPVIVKSRDGLDLVSYLTMPRDAKGPLPMVLLVHGGPWSRDEYSLNARHQWLASRGYAVLSVNYRGSTGFGKKFVNAADKQWSGKMHDDLIDAVDWAVQQKIAQKDKVAIFGGSYGGYSTLVGLTFTPDVFACGVDMVGPSNLVTLLQAIPPYWESEVEKLTARIGDHRTEEGRRFLLSVSPISRVDRIKRPLLIGQGANDPRVKQVESDSIVKAMQAKSIPVTYVLYPDEGHGFARPENRKSFNAVSEIFLAQCLGGPYEPIGADFKGSTLTVPAGKENITSLSEALGAPR